MFAMLECLPPITLGIALFLAAQKSILLLDTFSVKRYINTRNSLIALGIILITKVSSFLLMTFIVDNFDFIV